MALGIRLGISVEDFLTSEDYRWNCPSIEPLPGAGEIRTANRQRTLAHICGTGILPVFIMDNRVARHDEVLPNCFLDTQSPGVPIPGLLCALKEEDSPRRHRDAEVKKPQMDTDEH